jgi:hypothetical protein
MPSSLRCLLEHLRRSKMPAAINRIYGLLQTINKSAYRLPGGLREGPRMSMRRRLAETSIILLEGGRRPGEAVLDLK